MPPETLIQTKLSRGEAKHVRFEKALKRRNDANEMNRKIMERLEVSDRLVEIGRKLTHSVELEAMPAHMREQETVMLTFEQFWLKAKIGLIKSEEQQHLYLGMLTDLQQRSQDTYAWFITAGDGGLSRAEKLRESILPKPVLRK